MRRVLWAIMVAGLWITPCSAQTIELSPEFWLAPRSGQAVRDNPQLQATVAAYLQSPQARLRLHYQKRDESTAQAEELRGWLIALGIEADRIDLEEDNTVDPIKLEVMESR